MNVSVLINEDLKLLRTHFNARGFDIRIVGGAVRDFIAGAVPHDIDLCTDAFPDEQLAIYEECGIHFIPTGVQHGTYTAVMNGEGYEITSLRTESEHDGRHAVMAFTRDWTEDASRRDLTINAMALTFNGELVDPFGGAIDLQNNVVRFVGEANERMTEDYLRILRYFRFLGRYSDEATAKATVPAQAIYDTVNGLAGISAERIWTEIKKIMAHPSASWVISMMEYHSVFDVIQFPTAYDQKTFFELKENGCTDPVLLTVARMQNIDRAGVDVLAARFKWSSDEHDVARKIAEYRTVAAPIAETKRQLVHNRHPHAEENLKHVYSKVVEFYTAGREVDYYKNVVVPVFPVTGEDLAAIGVERGSAMGHHLKEMKTAWMDSNYVMTRDELLATYRK